MKYVTFVRFMWCAAGCLLIGVVTSAVCVSKSSTPSVAGQPSASSAVSQATAASAPPVLPVPTAVPLQPLSPPPPIPSASAAPSTSSAPSVVSAPSAQGIPSAVPVGRLPTAEVRKRLDAWLKIHQDRQSKMRETDILPREPFKATAIRFKDEDAKKFSNVSSQWSQIRLDLDRDGVEDEKWLLMNGKIHKREVLDRNGQTTQTEYFDR